MNVGKNRKGEDMCLDAYYTFISIFKQKVQY